MQTTTTTTTTNNKAATKQATLPTEADNYAAAARRIAVDACHTYTHITSYDLQNGLDWAALAYKRWTLKASRKAQENAAKAAAATDPVILHHWTTRAADAAKETEVAADGLTGIAEHLLATDPELAAMD